jgi:hypothetical protein
MSIENPAEIIKAPFSSRNATGLGIAQPFKVKITDPTTLKHIRKPVLRKALLPRNWHITDINEQIDPNTLQRHQEVLNGTPFVSDRMQRPGWHVAPNLIIH